MSPPANPFDPAARRTPLGNYTKPWGPAPKAYPREETREAPPWLGTTPGPAAPDPSLGGPVSPSASPFDPDDGAVVTAARNGPWTTFTGNFDLTSPGRWSELVWVMRGFRGLKNVSVCVSAGG